MKHTPGPWKVQKPDNQSYAHTITGDGFWIADIAHGAIEDDDIANARLIAAAPELLEALMFIVNDAPEGEDAQLTVTGYNKACAAILKAIE